MNRKTPFYYHEIVTIESLSSMTQSNRLQLRDNYEF